MVHRKSNPRKGIYSSRRSDAKTDPPVAELGQASPLSEPNSPDNHAGEPALDRSNSTPAEKPDPAGDTQGHREFLQHTALAPVTHEDEKGRRPIIELSHSGKGF